MTAAHHRRALGLLDRLTVYVVGKYGRGWVCSTCDRRFHHGGQPRRTFLALLDHVVLDHHRLPLRHSRARLILRPEPVYITSGTATGTTYTFRHGYSYTYNTTAGNNTWGRS